MYDTNQTAITNTLTAASTVVFSQATIDTILGLVTTPLDPVIVAEEANVTLATGTLVLDPATEIAFVTIADAGTTALAVTGSAAVVLFQNDADGGGVNATFNTAPSSAAQGIAAAIDPFAIGDTVERVIVGTSAADTITILDGVTTHVVAGGGDTVNVSGSAHTIVTAAEGSSVINGNGDTIVMAVGSDADFTVVAGTPGRAVATNSVTGVSVDVSDIQFVQLTDNDASTFDDGALIFAADQDQAVIANLYQAVFGRAADAAGLDYWFDTEAAGQSIELIAGHFLASAEYAAAVPTPVSDQAFVQALYQNALGRASDAGGEAFWVGVLAAAPADRDYVAAMFAEAAVTSGEPGVDGSVTIVAGINGLT